MLHVENKDIQCQFGCDEIDLMQEIHLSFIEAAYRIRNTFTVRSILYRLSHIKYFSFNTVLRKSRKTFSHFNIPI